MNDTETAYALAIAFDLLSTPEQRQHAGDRLAELARDSGYHIRTGFVGTPLICDALCSTGHFQASYRLLLQRECPSWLYPVTMGATTVWERWDSILPDGSINPGEMTSFNHYALGAVADWMHRTIGGLTPSEPGYRRMEIYPRPGGGLTFCRVTHLTPYRLAECAWRIEAGKLDLDVIIPANTTASVIVPGENTPLEVGSGLWHWSVPYQDSEVRGAYTVDDMVGEILSEPTARAAVMDALERIGAPGFERMVIFDEPNIPLRQALQALPDYEQAVTEMNKVLTSL